MKKECLVKNCKLEQYEKSDKCILHCEKDDWYAINDEGNKDWSQSEDKIKEFWKEIRNILKTVSKDIINLSNFIFPKFEEITPDDRVQLHNEDYILKQKTTSKNFWSNGSIIEFNYDIWFTKCTFLDTIDFYGCKFQSVIFVESEIREPIHFTESKIFGLLKFHDTIIQKSLDFKRTELSEIVIEKCKEINKISFNRSTIRAFIIIQSDSIINDLNFELCRFKVLKINDCYINKLELLKYSSCLDYMQFINFKANSIYFKDFDVYNCKTIYLNYCTFDIFVINHLIGQAEFTTLSDLIVDKTLEIENSNCSNFEFHNSNFEKAKKTIKNIAFQGNNGFTIFNGVKWGDIRKTFDKATDRDTFRQLKYVNEKQGNIIEANKFYSAEMKAYKKELYKSRCYQRLQDKFIFCANMVVSNFSKNWILPILWFFGSGFIAYSLNFLEKIILYISGDMQLTSLIIKKHLANYFVYINPFNTNPVGNSIIWFGFKVLSVFFIYQFIISLRRQTRR